MDNITSTAKAIKLMFLKEDKGRYFETKILNYEQGRFAMKRSLIVKIILWWYVITLLCWLIFGLIDNEKWFDLTLSKYAYGSFGILFLIFFGICTVVLS